MPFNSMIAFVLERINNHCPSKKNGNIDVNAGCVVQISSAASALSKHVHQLAIYLFVVHHLSRYFCIKSLLRLQ